MTITPIAFTNSDADIATDADLRKLHPDMGNNIWVGVESYRTVLEESYEMVGKAATARAFANFGAPASEKQAS